MLNPNEIKKALECCSKEEINGLNIFTYGDVPMRTLLKFALDLINQYEAEMQHYKEKLHNRKSEVNRLNSKVKSLKYNLKTAKAEAKKEFAERLKIRFSGTLQVSGWLIQKVVEDILQEMGVE